MIFKKSLISLAIGGFGIGLTEFVIMWILTQVEVDMHVTTWEAGHFIGAYALGVVIGAPILVLFAGSYPPKRILQVLMLAFTVFNSLTIFAPNYEFMIVSRLLSGLPHGAFFGVGAVVASRLVDKGREASAVAMMLGGLTVANCVGIPLGLFLAQALSWRFIWVFVALVGLMALAAITFWMPNLPKNTKSNPRNDLRVFLKPEPWFVLAITAIGTGGFFAWISYIKPLLLDVTGFEENGYTFYGIIILAGLGMTVGNFAGGRLADKVSPGKAIAILLSIMSVCLILVSVLSPYKVPTIIMTFVAAFFAFSTASPIQMLMINASRGSEMLASSTNQAGFNAGNALGAFLGGLPIKYGFGNASPEWVGASLAFCGVLITLLMLMRRKRKSTL